VCGEEVFPLQERDIEHGSPPRVRGGAPARHTPLASARITPACAGRRCTRAAGLRRQGDHPRVCGEEGTWNSKSAPKQGSPPRVRGGVNRLKEIAGIPRITPACAGRSKSDRKDCGHRRDHPRVCGEERPCRWKRRFYRGSPPRVRGGADGGLALVLHIGITPACAGRRTCSAGGTRTAGDHPRVCGEESGRVLLTQAF